jgi:peroxiredoxin
VVVAVSVLVPLAVLVVALSADDDGDATAGPAVDLGALAAPGDVAPAFDAPGLDGGRVRLADYRGRPVILTFFASWCNPCEQEIPHLNDALAEHADDGLAVIGVNFDEALAQDSRDFRERLDATWPAGDDPDGVVAEAYGVRTLPVTFFIGPDGRIVDRGFGLTTEDALTEPLDHLLAASPAS